MFVAHPTVGFSTERLVIRGMWGEPTDRAAIVAVLRRAVHLGARLVEVVAGAGPITAEDLVREALHPYPEDLSLALRTTRPEQAAARAHRLATGRLDLLLIPAEHLTDALGAARTLGLIDPTAEALATASKITPIAAVRRADHIEWLDNGGTDADAGIRTGAGTRTVTRMVAAATLAEIEQAMSEGATPPSAEPE